MLRTGRFRGSSGMRRPRAFVTMTAALSVVVLLAGCSGPLSTSAPTPVGHAVAASASPTAQPFDPSVGAPLPYDRIVAAYGIYNGVEANGPSSSIDMLTSFQPQLEQLGQQYAALDPTHPVKLAVDLVVNVFQTGGLDDPRRCYSFLPYCTSWAGDDVLQPYIDYCQKHNMLLIMDLQLGTEPVAHAVAHVEPYLKKYPFVELQIDTEFHFPDTPYGFSQAIAYARGQTSAAEINWAISDLAQISLQNHLPRKMLVFDEFDSYILPDKDKVQRNPNVSVVLQSDGWGGYSAKLGDYQVFVQQDLVEYGGYKLFLPHPGDTYVDYNDNGVPGVQSPDTVMQLFPQPLWISYQ